MGGAIFEKTLPIETVKPNRLKVKLDFGKERLSGTNATGQLEARWLHGADAGGLKAQYDLTLTATQTTFDGLVNLALTTVAADHFMPTPDKCLKVISIQKEEPTVSVTLKPEQKAPGALRAIFSGKVFEPGGDFSVDRFAIPYYPYNYLCGYNRVAEPEQGDYYHQAGKILVFRSLL